MSELEKWSNFLQNFIGIGLLKDAKYVEINEDGQVDLPMSVNYIANTGFPHIFTNILIDEYMSFIERSGILQRLLSLIPSTIKRPIFFHRLWPSRLRLVPIIENGKTVFMLRGDARSFITCKFFRLKSLLVPQVDFVPADRVVNCIIRSDIAWPIVQAGGVISELFEMIKHLRVAGFQDIKRFRDAKGKYWVFPKYDTVRKLVVVNHHGTVVKMINQKDILKRPNNSEVYPPEYKLPEIDREFVSPEYIFQVIKKIASHYSIPTKFLYLEMIVSLLAMKIDIPLDGDIRNIFADNLYIFGYCRTPINVSFLRAEDYWARLLRNPEILYMYQSLRDELDQQIDMPSEITQKDAIEPEVIVPEIEWESSPIPFRSYGIVKNQVKQQAIRQIHSKAINKIIGERKVEPGSLEAKNIVALEYERVLTSQEENEIKIQVENKSYFNQGNGRWNEVVDWPAFDELDSKQVNIHGIRFSINEIKYVFHNTVLESLAESESEGDITPTTISLHDVKLIKSFLEGSLPPEQFYTDLSDTSFVELSIQFSYLDYYERPDNRALINLEFILNRPFVQSLQRVQEKFFASSLAPRQTFVNATIIEENISD